MGRTEHNLRLDYVAFAVPDLERVKHFYGKVFGWQFEDFGPDYTALKAGRMDVGFWRGASAAAGLPAMVRYALDLEAVAADSVAYGGAIVKEFFTFPGGRRFHFADPCGNVLAVWNDQEAV